jgi:hypothetical protein
MFATNSLADFSVASDSAAINRSIRYLMGSSAARSSPARLRQSQTAPFDVGAEIDVAIPVPINYPIRDALDGPFYS